MCNATRIYMPHRPHPKIEANSLFPTEEEYAQSASILKVNAQTMGPRDYAVNGVLGKAFQAKYGNNGEQQRRRPCTYMGQGRGGGPAAEAHAARAGPCVRGRGSGRRGWGRGEGGGVGVHPIAAAKGE